ncbi:F-box family protein [Striga asiatica]|uniref:F-box family protein n=1 Tax=Striga asiatica TaxID=4170 RepID=A0A5A7Q6J1_STRAF|nr:F-box family protein [Striga asiatica]
MELDGTEKQIIMGGCSSKTSYLPEDILEQILSVLGLVLRTHKVRRRCGTIFEYIARTFRHPCLTHFISDHLPEKWYSMRESIPGHYLSIQERNGGPKLLAWEECLGSSKLPFKPSPDDLVSSCNGLLLFVDIETSRYYVSNPMTGQCVPIPQPAWAQERLLFAALAFDPSRSSSYTVVRFAWRTTKPEMVLDVYTSADKSWSSHELQLDPCMTRLNMMRPATYFEGALFRLSLTWHVVRFNFYRELAGVRVAPLPLSYKQCKGLMGSMGVLAGKLCYSNEFEDMLHVWSLGDCSFDVKSSCPWELRYRIDIYDLTRGMVLSGDWPPISKWVETVAFHPSANVLYLGTPRVILTYDLESNNLEELTRIERDGFLPGCYCAAFTCIRFPVPFDDAGNICAPNC